MVGLILFILMTQLKKPDRLEKKFASHTKESVNKSGGKRNGVI